jgi:putative PEP-CTERM system integral membrane protein
MNRTTVFAQLRTIGAYGLFWSWNIIFLTFLVLGFVPIVAVELFWAMREGIVPAPFLIYASTLAAIPAIAILLVVFTRLHKEPGRLLAFGYGVEGPLMILLGIRFFAIRQVVPAVALLLLVAALGMFTLLWQLLDHKIDTRGRGWPYLRVAGLTLLLAIGLYISTWLFFYTIPLMVELFKAIAELISNLPSLLGDLWFSMRTSLAWQVPFMAVYLVLGSLLFVYTATLVIVLPIVVPILYARAWARGLRGVVARVGALPAYSLALVVLVSTVSLFLITNRQPQHRAFALLASPPATVADATALAGQQEEIRAGLLNAYLAPFRYVSSVGEVYHIRDMYNSAFNLSWSRSAPIQQLYEWVARPLLYEPAVASAAELRARDQGAQWDTGAARPIVDEPQRAAELYEQFFDVPINEGEHAAIVDAVRTTWDPAQAEAAWQAVDHREVHLTHQEVTITEHGDWADVELYEVYENRTFQRQEVVYYFSLPESAVITGVWLGTNGSREERSVYQVAPRGAAQATYRAEVRRRVDPALVEQIGPRQYRLRIFPIEPRQQEWNGTGRSTRTFSSPPLHMWLTWRVFATDGAWPMPQLAERRNVYWDGRSARLLNGADMTTLVSGDRDDNATWLPTTVVAANDTIAQIHRVDYPDGRSVIVQPVVPAELPQPAGDLTLAVVLDRSRSMVGVADQVESALARFAELMASGTRIDVYLTASPYRGEGPAVVDLAGLDVADILYYGGQNSAELLAQYHELHEDQRYDGVFVLTDGTGYALGEGDVTVEPSGAPVWMVHLGGFPLGYDDPTLEVIQASGGGVTDNLADALTRFAVARVGLPGLDDAELLAAAPDVVDGYAWALLDRDAAQEQYSAAVVHQPSEPFAAFAGRRMILAEMMRNRGDLAVLDILDDLHALAIEHSIVTPYSSMIVLVNERQQQLLDELSAQEDRFDREFEDVGETAETNILTGVPEPEEWLLIFVAAGLLGWYLYQSRERLLARG